jgi:oxygen-independent coproporphyrinogen-3 oxidase
VQAGGVIDCDVTPLNEVLLETLMLGLRLAEGLSLVALVQGFGEEKVEEICQCLQGYFEKGWVEVIEGRLRFIDPQGFLFSNVILADLFEKLG